MSPANMKDAQAVELAPQARLRREMGRFFAFHLGFTLLCGGLWPLPTEHRGIAVALLVVVYNLALPGLAWWWGERTWWLRWRFLAPLSALQVIPDGFLASVLGVLVFPDPGIPQLFGVPLSMAGMWTIPLFAILTVGDWVQRTRSAAAACWAVALTSAALFVGSEAVLWRLPLWHATGVATWGHVALYVVVPEIVLGLSTFAAFERLAEASWPRRLLAALALMTLYLGSLGVSFLVLEGPRLPGI